MTDIRNWVSVVRQAHHDKPQTHFFGLSLSKGLDGYRPMVREAHHDKFPMHFIALSLSKGGGGDRAVGRRTSPRQFRTSGHQRLPLHQRTR